MSYLRKATIVVALLTLTTINVHAAGGDSQKRRGRHQGPPPEAYMACEDKSVGILHSSQVREEMK